MKKTKILVTGGSGMLARSIETVLNERRDLVLMMMNHEQLDITNKKQLHRCMRQKKPDVVIHCAAYTDVDGCELEPGKAHRINAIGTANVAVACNAIGARLLAISTDYVFDGQLNRPYNEDDKAGGSRTVYGRTKYTGEQRVRIFCPNHCICRVA